MFYRAEDLNRTRRFASHRADEEMLRRAHSSLQTGAPKRLKQLREELGDGRALTKAVRLGDDGGAAPTADPAIAADTVVVHRQWGRGVVLDGDSDRLVVLFDDYGYRTMDLGVVRSGGLLDVP